jgi:hypothetical protein
MTTSKKTTLAMVQAATKAFVTTTENKAAKVFETLQAYLGDQGVTAENLTAALDGIKTAASEASESGNIPATLKQYSTMISKVAGHDEYGVEWVQKAGSFSLVRNAYENIKAAAKAAKAKQEGEGEGEGEAAAESESLAIDTFMKGLIQYRAGLDSKGRDSFDALLSEAFAKHSAPKRKAKAKPEVTELPEIEATDLSEVADLVAA